MPLTADTIPAQVSTHDRETWLAAAWLHIATSDGLNPNTAREVVPLPSFPRTRVRTGTILGELAPITTGRAGRFRAALVSPALSQTPEVVTVLDYLHTRWRATYWNAYNPTRPSAAERHRLEVYGYEAPFSRIVPGPRAWDRIHDLTARLVADLGNYPHEPVAVATHRPQTTRMLKASCQGSDARPHDDYIVRISQAQADRGLPICPVCWATGLPRTLVLAS